MSFAALSVSSARSEVMDFSVPFFYSGVSFLAAPQQKSEIPLHAFLLPFSPELWIAIFLSLNLTAIAVAVYEWLSPFGLNPWGRQRSKNFSIASALWVMWGLLCGHLVAFKAPKSWPNKFLINVWGGFSVLFVASYTANIAALIAGLFFHNAVSNYHDRSLLSQRVGAPRHSAADYYVHRANPHLWEHMQRFSVATVEEGVHRLRNGSLDILIADTPILDYYRATDHGCKLQKIGDAINEDTYAVGMTKGFPLKDSISAVIAKYTSNGYMDILQEKWYGGLPCFKLANDMVQPRPLGVAAVAGVFILLGLGMAVGILILVVEHLFYRYTLPLLRHKPKGTIWKSRNIMFFSQKLYRFINCVELVSPHHAARELVHTLRQGQITSLFQKSVKREHEQRRRRKSKAQFFEMIQEIRRVQQEERAEVSALPGEDGADTLHDPGDGAGSLRPDGQRRRSKSPCTSRLDIARRLSRELFSRSPKGEESGSRSSLSVRRFSSEAALSPRMLGAAVGRRLSKGSTSPPDINTRRASHLDPGGGKFNPIAASCAAQSRSTGRLFHGRNGGNGASAAGGLAGGSGAAGAAGTSAELGTVPSVVTTPEAINNPDTLLEETEEDEECKAALDAAAAAAVASRRHSSKGSGGAGRAARQAATSTAAGTATLRRLSRDELMQLSRCSETELRDHLLRAIREKDRDDPP
ncbi:glutamate receptor ionotropic, NMDA 3A-like [Frankliniella occidentalis]|uniref:Glutamate receptor ionotropic, NMDA 3A-like n=1 Tax=Frankliniella occidentalis TaxID=133901 RepID=A0A9C6X0G3_FRAOC|nr:glutamate receptor ionotropic, NMDA 3A-like [Frankliniella occidentalis]